MRSHLGEGSRRSKVCHEILAKLSGDGEDLDFWDGLGLKLILILTKQVS
jgi:hypothetical protein